MNKIYRRHPDGTYDPLPSREEIIQSELHSGDEVIEWIKCSDKSPTLGQYIAIEHNDKVFVCIYVRNNEAFPFSNGSTEIPIWKFERWIPVYFYP